MADLSCNKNIYRFAGKVHEFFLPFPDLIMMFEAARLWILESMQSRALLYTGKFHEKLDLLKNNCVFLSEKDINTTLIINKLHI